MTSVQWVATTPQQYWLTQELPAPGAMENTTLQLTGARYQSWEGFGGCFNELGWVALAGVDAALREEVMRALFSAEGCAFTCCRLPIGASDYGVEWYSHNETDGDFAMEHFSIARDQQYLLPYIKFAQQYAAGAVALRFTVEPADLVEIPRAYNYGTLIWKPECLQAYARYFLKFIRAYRAAGIPIAQVHVQNEPVADQKFPSCLWTGEQLRDFIRDYLGPLFAQQGEDCEIWLGTLNTADYDGFPHTVLSDPAARQYIAGVGMQWDSKAIVQRTAMAWPAMRLMQTENECGDGRNTWDYAQYVFGLLWHYLTNGVHAYAYWNMVLQPRGESTWGWKQNALITADPATNTITYNPEFYVMKHFAHFVQPGAVRLGVTGPWAGNTIAFENPDGASVYIVMNPFDEARAFTAPGIQATLAPHSFNTFVERC